MMRHATAETTPEPEHLRAGALLQQPSVSWKYSFWNTGTRREQPGLTWPGSIDAGDRSSSGGVDKCAI